MNILSIGGFSGLGNSNTCTLRNDILKEHGDVTVVDTTRQPITLWYRICNRLFRARLPIALPDHDKVNTRIRQAADHNKYDLIWIDKGILISRSTMRYLRHTQPSAKIVGYSPDWMGGRHNQSLQFLESLPLYDCYVTTKSYSVPELKSLGAKDVLFIDNAYQEGFHKPYILTREESELYGSDISFIGAWEKERGEMISYLADNDLKISVWGSEQWQDLAVKHPNIIFKGRELTDNSYPKALSASKVSLCFLRKMNRDLQTTRSIEIPACGAMMIAERTMEHQRLFIEDKEAAYFDTKEELLQKCRFYLQHESDRQRIAQAGYKRCVKDDYSYRGRINSILKRIFEKTNLDGLYHNDHNTGL